MLDNQKASEKKHHILVNDLKCVRIFPRMTEIKWLCRYVPASSSRNAWPLKLAMAIITRGEECVRTAQ